MKKTWVLLTFSICLSATLGAFVCHISKQDSAQTPVAFYTIVDLGETDVDLAYLAKSAKRRSLGPRINNDGVIIGNMVKGGFVTLPGKWMFSPQYEGMKINFHGINDQGDLLVAIHRKESSIEWMRWPCQGDNYGTIREHIHTIDPFVDKFFMTGFDNNGTAIAYDQTKEGRFIPVSSLQGDTLKPLGESQNLNLFGTTRSVNNCGFVVGVIDQIVDQAPFIWSTSDGLAVMNNYRGCLDPTGWVEFVDLYATDDYTIYGTYKIKHLAESHVVKGHFYETRQANGSYYDYNAFVWTPCRSQIQMLDLSGMRLNGVNKNHVLVGALNSQAMIRLPGEGLTSLSSLMQPSEISEWKLLEITDINDLGQVVGYGWNKDKIRFFLANPL